MVGILAAICGITATMGFNLLNSKPSNTEATTLAFALSNIDVGQEIKANMLSKMDWYGAEPPRNSYSSFDEIVGKFAVTDLVPGQMILKPQLADSRTWLQPADGKLAFTIDSKEYSTNLGENLRPGNRVDVLWSSDSSGRQRHAELPFSCRLLENVKVLAVGKIKDETEKDQKSLTLEVNPKMDEILQFAQQNGKLAISLRAPGDSDGIEPREITNLQTVLIEAQNDKVAMELANKNEQAEAEGNALASMLSKYDQLASDFSALRDSVASDKETLAGNVPVPLNSVAQRIKKGMRAITIRTPDESSGLAGLLEPGDRVDLIFTLQDKTFVSKGRAVGDKMPSTTLIENLEVLAVDTALESVEGDSKKSLAKSLTLLINDNMKQDIARAMQLGTITFVLRGEEDRGIEGPVLVISVDEFLARFGQSTESDVYSEPAKILTLRGAAVSEIDGVFHE